jgi:hypothetical protein
MPIRLGPGLHVDAQDPDVVPRLAAGHLGRPGPFGSPACTNFAMYAYTTS